MATIESLKKQYDKLTARERFALLVAAKQRGDKAESKALQDSAPRTQWRVIDTYGIAEGFNYIAMYYMMTQLGDLLSMYWLMAGAAGEDGEKSITFMIEGEETKVSFDDYFDKIARRLSSYHLAWLKLCKEYKVDSEVMLEGLPGGEIMQLCLLLTDGAARMIESPEAQPTDESVEVRYQDMKAALEGYIKQWS